MWDEVGIVRNEAGLTKALQEIDAIEREAPPGAWTLHNMLQTSRLIARAALMRQESRGGHYREDFPHESAEWRGRRINL